jgi:hypothetical protein
VLVAVLDRHLDPPFFFVGSEQLRAECSRREESRAEEQRKGNEQ